MRYIENIKFQIIWEIAFDLFSVNPVKCGGTVFHLIVGIRPGVIFGHFLAMGAFTGTPIALRSYTS
jgi:hypothetical protein